MSLSFSSIAAAVEAEAKKAIASLGPLWAAFKPVAEATAEELAAIALQSMIAQIPAVASGQEKLSVASSNVAVTLGTQGKIAAANLITAAVQIAFNQVQSMRPVFNQAQVPGVAP